MSVSSKDLKTQDNYRNRLSTVDRKGKRAWIFPKKPVGRFYEYRKYVSYVLLAILFATPFIQVNGRPFFMLNVLERKFIIFGQLFWPQDFLIFMLSIVTLIVFIILFTVIYGRVFCGWACPQTIFMEMVYRRIEYWIDGDRAAQKKLADAPWTEEKVRKRVLKYSIFSVIALLIGNLVMAYVVGVDRLFEVVTQSPTANLTEFTLVIAFSAAFMFVFSYFREQACTVVCPYGRLQGVMLDKQSVVVAYDYVRGEGRAKNTRNRPEDAGDCIDCYQCVDVCPTGIDIRNGTQLECVACTACIDACDGVMKAIGKEPNLIRMASEDDISKGEKPRFTVRKMAYTAVLAVLVSAISILLLTRSEVGANINRARGSTYSITPDGQVMNVYTIKLANKSWKDQQIDLKLESDLSGELSIVGGQAFEAPKESLTEGVFTLTIPKDQLITKSTDLEVGLYSEGELQQTVDISFLKP